MITDAEAKDREKLLSLFGVPAVDAANNENKMKTYRVILKSGADFLVEAEGIATNLNDKDEPDIRLINSKIEWVALTGEVAAIVEVEFVAPWWVPESEQTAAHHRAKLSKET